VNDFELALVALGAWTVLSFVLGIAWALAFTPRGQHRDRL
jgi:hypothetical protein